MSSSSRYHTRLTPVMTAALGGFLLAVVRASEAMTLHFTGRDFIQSACMTPAMADEAWGTLGNGVAYPVTLYDTNACPFYNDVVDGLVSGHPDFETDVRFFSVGTSGVSGGIQSQVTRAVDGTLYPYGLTNTTGEELTMAFDETGIPKLAPCDEASIHGPKSCGLTVRNGGATRTYSSTTSFASFYVDNPKYNKRVSYTLTLTSKSSSSPPSSSGDELNSSSMLAQTYEYGSEQFFPMDQFPRCGVSSDNRVDCSNGGKVWPPSRGRLPGVSYPGLDCNPLNEVDVRTQVCTSSGSGQCKCAALPQPGAPHNWLFTSYASTLIQHQGGVFAFEGDDDFWVFINNRKAIDLGGLHEGLAASLNLSDERVASRLGLERGKIYALDIFHAERHSVGSTFKITTNLVQACTATQFGMVGSGVGGEESFIAIRGAYSSSSDEAGIGPGGVSSVRLPPPSMAIDDDGNSTVTTTTTISSPLIFPSSDYTSNALWSPVALDVSSSGFSVRVEFSLYDNNTQYGLTPGVDTPPLPIEGLALVVTDDPEASGSTNLRTGGHLGTPVLSEGSSALIVALDLCPGKGAYEGTRSCRQLRNELRLHRAADADDTTISRLASLTHPNLVRSTGTRHVLELIHHGSHANWLDVRLDGDLFLQDRNLSMTRDVFLAGKVFVGLTSASTSGSLNPLGTRHDGLIIHSFQINSAAVAPLSTSFTGFAKTSALANGNDSISILISAKDGCGFPITGASPSLFQGELLYGDDTPVSSVSSSTVRDEGNGVYVIEFTSNVAIPHFNTLVITSRCDPRTPVSISCEDNVMRIPLGGDVASELQFTALPPPRNDTNAEVTTIHATGGSLPVTELAVTIVFLLLAFGCCVGLGVRYRDRWRREKVFVIPGKVHEMEQGVKFANAGNGEEASRIAKLVQEQFAEINRFKAIRRGNWSPEKAAEIEGLRATIRDIREEILRLRFEKQEAEFKMMRLNLV